MSRYFNRLAITFSLALGLGSGHSMAGVLFEDGFESGNRRTAMNGFYWGGSTDNVRPTTSRALTGNYSLEFPFAGVPSGQDSFEEQRIHFGKPYTELWFKYDLYIPSNYVHRRNEGDNNKFFAIFNNSYRPGFQVNFSLYPDYRTNSGGSNIVIHYFRNGVEQPYIDEEVPFIRSADLGKWHRIVMHFKVPTTLNTSDGVMEIWKNGELIISKRNLASNGTSGLNYMDEAYILGWANSGFSQTTYMYVDNFVISDSAISPGADAPRAVVSPPNPPSLTVQ
jgi:hypothetical protein